MTLGLDCKFITLGNFYASLEMFPVLKSGRLLRIGLVALERDHGTWLHQASSHYVIRSFAFSCRAPCSAYCN